MTEGGFLIPEGIREAVRAEVSRKSLRRAGLPPTPEQVAEMAEWQRTRAEYRAAVEREHGFLLADVPRRGLAEEMLTLHAPNAEVRCDGCDFSGYEAESPEWPCRSYRRTAERYSRRFVEDDHGTRMERIDTRRGVR